MRNVASLLGSLGLPLLALLSACSLERPVNSITLKIDTAAMEQGVSFKSAAVQQGTAASGGQSSSMQLPTQFFSPGGTEAWKGFACLGLNLTGPTVPSRAAPAPFCADHEPKQLSVFVRTLPLIEGQTTVQTTLLLPNLGPVNVEVWGIQTDTGQCPQIDGGDQNLKVSVFRLGVQAISVGHTDATASVDIRTSTAIEGLESRRVFCEPPGGGPIGGDALSSGFYLSETQTGGPPAAGESQWFSVAPTGNKTLYLLNELEPGAQVVSVAVDSPGITAADSTPSWELSVDQSWPYPGLHEFVNITVMWKKSATDPLRFAMFHFSVVRLPEVLGLVSSGLTPNASTSSTYPSGTFVGIDTPSPPPTGFPFYRLFRMPVVSGSPSGQENLIFLMRGHGQTDYEDRCSTSTGLQRFSYQWEGCVEFWDEAGRHEACHRGDPGQVDFPAGSFACSEYAPSSLTPPGSGFYQNGPNSFDLVASLNSQIVSFAPGVWSLGGQVQDYQVVSAFKFIHSNGTLTQTDLCTTVGGSCVLSGSLSFNDLSGLVTLNRQWTETELNVHGVHYELQIQPNKTTGAGVELNPIRLSLSLRKPFLNLAFQRPGSQQSDDYQDRFYFSDTPSVPQEIQIQLKAESEVVTSSQASLSVMSLKRSIWANDEPRGATVSLTAAVGASLVVTQTALPEFFDSTPSLSPVFDWPISDLSSAKLVINGLVDSRMATVWALHPSATRVEYELELAARTQATPTQELTRKTVTLVFERERPNLVFLSVDRVFGRAAQTSEGYSPSSPPFGNLLSSAWDSVSTGQDYLTPSPALSSVDFWGWGSSHQANAAMDRAGVILKFDLSQTSWATQFGTRETFIDFEIKGENEGQGCPEWPDASVFLLNDSGAWQTPAATVQFDAAASFRKWRHHTIRGRTLRSLAFSYDPNDLAKKAIFVLVLSNYAYNSSSPNCFSKIGIAEARLGVEGP